MLWSFLRSTIRDVRSASRSVSPPQPTDLTDQHFDISQRAEELPAVTRIGTHTFLVKARHGVFLANANDFYIGAALIKYGEFSELEGQLFKRLVKPGDTVVEVGANIGAHTAALARHVGESGHVIAVEAQAFIYRQLTANMALNCLVNVTTIECGCGARTDVMYLPKQDYATSDFANFGGVSLRKETTSLETGATTVAIRTLDSIVGQRKVDFLKIDVEGMESEVLQGGLALIAKSRPVLYVENDRIDNSGDLIRLLFSLGYRLFWHLPPLFNEANFFREANNVFGLIVSWNMLCVPLEQDLQIVEMKGAEIIDPDFHPLRNPAETHLFLQSLRSAST